MGIVFWYGSGFYGKSTASGTIYDQNDLIVAYQTLLLGSRVMVINLNNGNAMEVTIIDCGPFVKGRIIDLFYGAGRSLGMIGPGTIPVRFEVIESSYRIQIIFVFFDYTLQ